MSKSFASRVGWALLILLFVACGGDVEPRTYSKSSAAALSVLARAVPARVDEDLDKPVPVWTGSAADLIFADAWASCLYPGEMLYDNVDEYQKFIRSKMQGAYCAGSPPPTTVKSEYAWSTQRMNEDCNVDATTGVRGRRILENKVPKLDHTVMPDPVAFGSYNSWLGGAGRAAVHGAVTNLCIAQHLRAAAPGASAGETLLLSAADQRQLLALTKERAQLAMIQLALLGQVFVTASVDPPSIATHYPFAYIPMLQAWAQYLDGLTVELGDQLAIAVQLHVTAAGELADLLSRSGAAHLPRGSSAADAAWRSAGYRTGAVETWGPGSWQQRALASLYGGDPLVGDVSGSTPWRHFKDSTGPGETGTADNGSWPDTIDSSFASTELTDPRVAQLYVMARRANALLLERDSAASTLPGSAYACTNIKRAESAKRLYRATEAFLRVDGCEGSYSQTTGTCLSLPDINSVTENVAELYSQFDLWKYYRIGPEHADLLVAWLDEISGKECTRTRRSWTGPGFATDTVSFNTPGALNSSGTIRTETISGKAYYRLDDFAPKPRSIRELAPLYTKNAGFWIADHIDPLVAAASQGFPASNAEVAYRPEYAGTGEEMRLAGAIPALAGVRDVILNSLKTLALPEGSGGLAQVARERVEKFFARKRQMLDVIDGAIGRSGISVTPATRVTTESVISGLGDTWSAQFQRHDYVVGGTGGFNVGVMIDSTDSFWSLSQGAYELFVIPEERFAWSLSLGDNSSAFNTTIDDMVVGGVGSSLVASEVLPPEGTSSLRRWFFRISPPLNDAQVTLVVRRTNGTERVYRPLLSHLSGFLPALSGATARGRGQYFGFGGTLGDLAARQCAVDLFDPSKAAFDGFGLPNKWMPPVDPSLFGGTAGDDAVSAYLRRARAGAEEGTAAVKEAFESMLSQEADERALDAATANSKKLAELERSALCGADINCNAEIVKTQIDVESIWNQNRGDLPTYAALQGDWCKPAPSQSVIERMRLLDASHRLACFALAIATRGLMTQAVSVQNPGAPLPFQILARVEQHRGAPTVPSFAEYAGGALQSVAIEQWTAIRSIEHRIEELIVAMRAADTHVRLLESASEAASTAEMEQRKRCTELVIGFKNDFENMPLGFEGASTTGGALATYGSWADKRRMCEAYRIAAQSAHWAGLDGFVQAYANLQQRVQGFTDAMSRLRTSVASSSERTHQANLAIARQSLELELLRDTQPTRFGVYRQLHSLDAWRAKALLESARVGAVVARRAVESRFNVSLSGLVATEPLVASPAMWADEIFEYDLDMPAAVGLSASAGADNGVYANRVLDYVGNLERFVSGFAIARPTVAAHSDSEVISLPGPLGMGPTSGAEIDGQAYAWSYFCPAEGNGAWKAMPETGGPERACGPAPARPTRALLMFRLDPWGRVHGEIADEPFVRRHNIRWERLAINLVGTGVLNCASAVDASTCYTQPFVRYRMSHGGSPWVSDAGQSWRLLPMPAGRVEGAKALAAEQWLDPVSNGWSRPYVASVARSELNSRPLGGTYEIEFELGPEVMLDRIERVQLLTGTSYWVAQQ